MKFWWIRSILNYFFCVEIVYKKVALILVEVAEYYMYCHLQILYANKIISSAYLPFILRDLSMRSPLNFHQQTNIFHAIDQLKIVTLSTHCKTSLFFPRHLDNMLISKTTIKVHIFTALSNDILSHIIYRT